MCTKGRLKLRSSLLSEKLFSLIAPLFIKEFRVDGVNFWSFSKNRHEERIIKGLEFISKIFSIYEKLTKQLFR